MNTPVKKIDLPITAGKILKLLDGFSWEQQQTVLQFVSRTILFTGPTEQTERDPGDDIPEPEDELMGLSL